MHPMLTVLINKRYTVTGTVTMGEKVLPVDSIMLGYTPDEACADAAWVAGQKELRHTGIFLTEQMYTYTLTATEIKP